MGLFAPVLHMKGCISLSESGLLVIVKDFAPWSATHSHCIAPEWRIFAEHHITICILQAGLNAAKKNAGNALESSTNSNKISVGLCLSVDVLMTRMLKLLRRKRCYPRQEPQVQFKNVCMLLNCKLHTYNHYCGLVTVYKYRTWISINCWSKKWEYMDLALIATGVKSGYDKGIKMLARPSIAQHCLVKRCKTFLPVMRIWCVCFRAASIPADCTSHSISTPERVVVWYLLFRKLEVSITFYFYCSSTVSQHLCSVALLRTLRMTMQLPAFLNSSSCSCGTFSRNFYPCTAKLLSTMDWKAKWVGGGEIAEYTV